MALLLAGGFIAWVLNEMAESTIRSQLGHIQITRPDYLSKGLGDPYSHLLPPKIDPAITSTSHVISATPRLAFSGLVSKGDETISFIGEGVAPETEREVSKLIIIAQGRDLSSSSANEVVLGSGLAANLAAHPGDPIVLLTTTASGGIGAVEAKVVGVFQTISKAYDDSVLRAPIDLARELMRVEGATSWVVLLDKTSATNQVRSKLATVLDSTEFEIFPWTALADFYNKTVELFGQQVGVVRLLIAFIVILSISNTLSMSVIERTSEIGTSMAIGLTRAGMLRQFLWEGAMLGLLGGVVGVGAGFILAHAISAVGIPMPPPPGMDVGYRASITITPGLALDGFLLAFLTTLIAGILPAWKASRMNIVDALRHQK